MVIPPSSDTLQLKTFKFHFNTKLPRTGNVFRKGWPTRYEFVAYEYSCCPI